MNLEPPDNLHLSPEEKVIWRYGFRDAMQQMEVRAKNPHYLRGDRVTYPDGSTRQFKTFNEAERFWRFDALERKP